MPTLKDLSKAILKYPFESLSFRARGVFLTLMVKFPDGHVFLNHLISEVYTEPLILPILEELLAQGFIVPTMTEGWNYTIPPLKSIQEKDEVDLNIKVQYTNFIAHFNRATEREFKGESKSLRQFGARIKEGFTYLEITTAVDAIAKDKFHKENKYRYATPEFITRADKLQQFLNIGNRSIRPVPDVNAEDLVS